MARRPYVFLAGDLSGWPVGATPTPEKLRNLDQYCSELLNGEDGGDWAPEDPIVFGPYGSPAVTMNTGAIQGDIETVKGNSRDEKLDQAGLVMQGTNFPVCAVSKSRVVVVPFTAFIEATSSATQNNPRFEVDPLTLGAKSIRSLNTSIMITVPLPLRAQHAGATIDQIDFRFVIANQRSVLPATMPRFRAIYVNSSGTVFPLHSAASPYDANGWFVDNAVDATAYYNYGRTRTLPYLPDQNNSVLDTPSGYYAVQARNEANGNNFLGNVFLSATLHLSNINDLRQE